MENVRTDVIAVIETWLTIDNAKDIDIPGYHFEYRCRNDRVVGEVGLFIKDGIVFNVLPITSNDDDVIQCIVVEISVANGKNILWDQYIDLQIPTQLCSILSYQKHFNV